MNILLLGSGGREHAMADKLAASQLCSNLFIAPGNAGTLQSGTNLDLDIMDFTAVKNAVMQHSIGMVVVGPEAPLVAGIVDYFEKDSQLQSVPIIGPTAKGAMLEGSKDFAKEFMVRHSIPTASYRTFTADQKTQAITYISDHDTPIVIKADGLAAGKGVIICETHEQALAETEAIFSGKFGDAGSRVVIESYLRGIEFSVFVLTDGNHYAILPEAKDYKRVGEGDTGPNTGGMGAVSPVPFADDALWKKVTDNIITPTIHGIRDEHIGYKGFIFFGLIVVGGEPHVIEYNCRMGDPETEVVMPRLQSDLGELLLATWEGRLADVTVDIDPRYAVAVMLVSGGYPDAYAKGKIIYGLPEVDGSRLYHAGTKRHGEHVITNGGRVMAVTSMASDLARAIEKSMRNAEVISFEGKNYRRDIGDDVVM